MKRNAKQSPFPAAEDPNISEARAEELNEIIFRQIILNQYAMSAYDYYLNLKECPSEKVKDHERQLYDLIQQNPQARLFIEITLANRYKESSSRLGKVRSETLQEHVQATRVAIEGAKIIPIERAKRGEQRTSIKVASSL